jgi:hypothetical protein
MNETFFRYNFNIYFKSFEFETVLKRLNQNYLQFDTSVDIKYTDIPE